MRQIAGVARKAKITSFRRLLLVCSVFVAGFNIVFLIAWQLNRSSLRNWKKGFELTDTKFIITEDKIKHENIPSKGLNQHTWEKNCLISLEQLCNFPIFPKAPDKRSLATNVNISLSASEVDGLRLLGFLQPNVTGEYLFSVTSNGFAEVWLSSSHNWKNGRKIAYTRPMNKSAMGFATVDHKFPTNGVKLFSGQRYYIEVIYSRGRQSEGQSLIQLAWKRPGRTGFELIQRGFFSPYKNDSDKAQLKAYDDDLPDLLACTLVTLNSSNKYMKPETLPTLESVYVSKALNFCEYRPSYLLDPTKITNFGRYHGVYRHAHKTFTFPNTEVEGLTPKRAARFLADKPMSEGEARGVVDKYMTALEESYPGKYNLESITRVEMKHDPQKGGRYFLQLVVKDLMDQKSYNLEEYVFQPYDKNGYLCYPMGLQWNSTADVYLILTAKNLGRWVHHFIKNVEKIIRETKDEHLHVIIYDYDSPDIDLKQELQRSTLQNYKYITKPGKYSRVESFSEAIQSILNPEAIFVTIDLHLDIGSQMVNDIRKHCFKGKTVYAPQMVFLGCGGSSALPQGDWYLMSYGIVAMYKQDWDNFGGFSKDFFNKKTWGGEDWDIIDGAVKGGLEIERKRSPWIYHYYHTKAGMWKQAT